MLLVEALRTMALIVCILLGYMIYTRLGRSILLDIHSSKGWPKLFFMIASSICVAVFAATATANLVPWLLVEQRWGLATVIGIGAFCVLTEVMEAVLTMAKLEKAQRQHHEQSD